MIDRELIDRIKSELDEDWQVKTELVCSLLDNYIKLIEQNAELHKENEMNLYKVTFVAGSNIKSVRVKAKNENLAWGYAKQYGLPSKVEPACSRWWYLIYFVSFLIGWFGAEML